MIEVIKEGVVLAPRGAGFESHAVLNPAAIRIGDEVWMLYRAVSESGISTIGRCRFNGPLRLKDRDAEPLLSPLGAEESSGIEDPRLVSIEGKYLLSYTSYDGVNALGSVATSYDLVHFTRKGIVVPRLIFPDFRRLAESSGPLNQKYARFAHDKNFIKGAQMLLLWDKDLIFFPRKIRGKLCFMHRIKPDIQIGTVKNLSELKEKYWKRYLRKFSEHILLKAKFPHESSYIGGGCPPVETPDGWVVIYHGVRDTPDGYEYVACAALLELDYPCREIARLPYALFFPERQWEREGKVSNVCFPCSCVVFSGSLYIYYGAADSQIACARVDLAALCIELLRYSKA